MTTYNHEKFISQAIDSVLMQKADFDYELLIGEDDSEDQTRDIVKNFAGKYPDKIRLFLNDRKNVIYINGRPTGRWNFINLLKHARGEYVALLDGDDYWTDPLKLQKQIAFLENHLDYFLCIHPCEFLIHNTDGSIIKNKQDGFYWVINLEDHPNSFLLDQSFQNFLPSQMKEDQETMVIFQPTI